MPRPPAPPTFAAPRSLVVPNVRPVKAGESSGASSSSSIYYPSQDPTRLGAKGDVIE
ncbi:Pre-mRNA-splicing factor RBM22 [Caenorhabditis elegans]|nr:Pre-mRNA-splicing factor RBM22 [Caenorhabditis elegans]CDR32740.1 Pre-mRNA-splicing factor RBM22 [Caenorhabditis elegans]|eukprot:NP_001293970.1 RNA Binding Motif protein homolog [Caenorhabditis elegans]